ncbi:hypothetical protein F5880DRAFT_1608389 [Lentinula raphanica]|nr:hypothetical protein F5880DRAFT_1608389 [Lentinula raphanica]
MADMDVFAAMGISGFGKSTQKKKLDPSRFDKNKRNEDVPPSTASVSAKIDTPGPSSTRIHNKGEEDEDTDDIGPPPPPAPQTATKAVDDEEPEYDPEDFQDLDEESEAPQFPTTHELILKDHTKVVSALALDPSGARIASGSHDYDCKLWDFGGMDMRCKPFKSWEPAGSYHIHDIKYSNDGQKFLVISGTIQAKLYDRDGEEQATFIKGDPYIRDMKNTSGHVGELSACAWHPKNPQLFITSSADSTIRIWDVENKRKQKTVIVVKSKERGARTKVLSCAYSPDGGMIGGVCLDGALHMWNTSSNFVRPNLSIEGAHVKGTETGSMVFSVDGRTVLTRGGDDTVKLWDLRAFKKPLLTRSELPTLYPNTNAIFSPDDKYVVTGAGATVKGGPGRLLFMRKDNLDIVKTLEVGATPVKVFWHSKINQIVTGLSNGQICVLYSPQTSLNGAKLLLNKGPPRKVTIEDMSDALAAPAILTPHALPMFRDGDGIARGSKRKREKDRMDPRKSRRPELPVTGPGKGGRVGASATQHVVQNLVRDTTRDEDPREALLRYANVAEEDPQWTAVITSDVELNGDQAPIISSNGDEQPINNDSHAPFPASPPTPVSNDISPDVKIDVDYEDQESDARNEPLAIENVEPVVEDIQNDVSTVVENGADVDSNSVPPDTPMDAVDSSENMPTPTNGVNGHSNVNGVNGIHADGDVNMEDHTPATTPDVSGAFFNGNNGSTAHTTPNDAADDDDVKPPPAKRARVHSDADQASNAHSATPPPPSASTIMPTPAAAADTVAAPPPPQPATQVPAVPPASGPSTLTVGQYRFCQSTVRSLKKLKDASPFLRPVDPIALNIPHYPSIIKNPMDFSTIERKLTASNPVKPDPNPMNPRYRTAEEFVADVRLIISNCVTFNGPDHIITAMGRRVEEVFDKQVKNMPTAEPPVVKKQSPPPPRAAVAAPPPPPVPVPAPAPAPSKKSAPRRPSTSVPTIRRNEAHEVVGRPKREIHPPAPKDLPYADAPKKQRKVKHTKDNSGSVEQLKYCSKILNDLHKKQYYTIANPFYEPVDWVKLEIPSYPKIIKKPMDMSTMRRKLDAREYRTASNFWDDFKLMIRNCFTFNPAGTVVNQAGQELQRIFDEKWKSLPPEPMSEDEEDEEEEEDSDVERARTIAMMESQIETIRGTISQLKSKPKDKKKKAKQEKAPVPSTSKASHPKHSKQPAPSKKKGKKAIADDDVLSFEQKKELSDAIQRLEGAKLEKVIQIIHEGVPEIRDSTEEIELDIDLLPVAVLTRLYNVVVRPLKAAPPKRSRPGKGTGTGGLKRKSMDEEVEAEKIRQLEQRMALFDQGANGAVPSGAHAHDSDRSSDSSSDDSSGSDSE